MAIPFAINGFGRIGRCLARLATARPDLELCAINDPAPIASLANLLRRDSVHGPAGFEITPLDEVTLRINGRAVTVFHEPEAAKIPWQQTQAKIVVEATGKATNRAAAAQHLRPDGPNTVLISAVAADADLTICLGINGEDFDPRRHHVLSNASCTTNCLALLLLVLNQEFGVEAALMNEAHSYTANQMLVDGAHSDPRRGRAAAINIVPTTTAAPQAVEGLLPALRGRVVGQAIRVPTPDVALLDLVAQLKVPASTAELRSAFQKAAQGQLLGLLAINEEPLVSSDFVGDPHSAIVDLDLLQTVGKDLVRVVAWYDNEWGYAARLTDLLTLIGAERQ
jgi:glyceraldehyde 3-phosphate dehydrogenase